MYLKRLIMHNYCSAKIKWENIKKQILLNSVDGSFGLQAVNNKHVIDGP